MDLMNNERLSIVLHGRLMAIEGRYLNGENGH